MIKVYDFTLQPYAPRNKCGAGAIIGGALSAIGALGAAAMSSSSARANNAASMNFAEATTREGQMWQDHMFDRSMTVAYDTEQRANAEYDRRKQVDMQSTQELTQWLFDNFNSPSAQVKALRAAGLNPALALGGSNTGFGTGIANAPSGSTNSINLPSWASPVFGSFPNLQNTGEPFSQSLNSAANAFNQMMQGDKTSQESIRLKNTQQIYYDTMFAEQQLKKTAQASAQFNLALDKLNLPKKQKYEIEIMHNQCNNLLLEGKFTQSKEEFTKLQSHLADIQGKKNSIELGYVQQLLDLQVNSATAEIAFKQQQKLTSKAQESAAYASAAESYAGAGHLKAQTTTINALRDFEVDLKRWDALLAKQQHGQKDARFSQELRILVNQANSSDFMPDTVKEELRRAVKENDWFVVKQILGITNTAVGAYGAYKGAKTGQGFVDAQDVRNQIQGDWIEWQKSRGKTYEVKGFQ